MNDRPYPESLEDYARICDVCGDELVLVPCWLCGGEGFSERFHDCGEDVCCCLDPEPGECPECHGEGFYEECPNIKNHRVIQ
jgi:hypothetical protein